MLLADNHDCLVVVHHEGHWNGRCFVTFRITNNTRMTETTLNFQI